MYERGIKSITFLHTVYVLHLDFFLLVAAGVWTERILLSLLLFRVVCVCCLLRLVDRPPFLCQRHCCLPSCSETQGYQQCSCMEGNVTSTHRQDVFIFQLAPKFASSRCLSHPKQPLSGCCMAQRRSLSGRSPFCQQKLRRKSQFH